MRSFVLFAGKAGTFATKYFCKYSVSRGAAPNLFESGRAPFVLGVAVSIVRNVGVIGWAQKKLFQSYFGDC